MQRMCVAILDSAGVENVYERVLHIECVHFTTSTYVVPIDGTIMTKLMILFDFTEWSRRWRRRPT